MDKDNKEKIEEETTNKIDTEETAAEHHEEFSEETSDNTDSIKEPATNGFKKFFQNLDKKLVISSTAFLFIGLIGGASLANGGQSHHDFAGERSETSHFNQEYRGQQGQPNWTGNDDTERTPRKKSRSNQEDKSPSNSDNNNTNDQDDSKTDSDENVQ